MRNIPLRAQVILVVAILCVSIVGAVLSTSAVTRSSQDSIVRLNRERLNALAANLAKRYGSVINFIAPEQFADSSLAHRTELHDLLLRITREELTTTPDAGAGFFHILWNSTVAAVDRNTDSPGTGREYPYQRLLTALIQTTVEQQTNQWSQFESGRSHFLLVSAPVYARNRLVGVAWTVDDLQDEFARPVPIVETITRLLPLTAIVGILLATWVVINLRREVTAIQEGLNRMRRDLSIRLPVAQSEFGSISHAINELSETIQSQQRETEALQREIQQKEKLASLGQLVAGVAHEIRTPLSAIKTRIQLWQRQSRQRSRRHRSGVREDLTQGSMAMVIQELDRMEKIVQKLLSFSRAQLLKMRSTNIHKLVRSSLRLLHNEITKRRIRVKTALKATNPMLRVDEAEMQKVFLNILTNALEAMPKGGRLTIRTERKDGTLTVAFEDTGTGIEPAVAERMFEPFFTTKDTGTGLGLSIAYEVVRAHRGTLNYATTPGKGTTFVITFEQDPSQAIRRDTTVGNEQ
jgi:signal transduction histidine kinase